MRFFKRLLKGEGARPLKVVADKLANYSAAKKELIPSAAHFTIQYENNGCDIASAYSATRTGHLRFFENNLAQVSL